MWTNFCLSLAVGIAAYNLLSLLVRPLSGVNQQKVQRVKSLGSEEAWLVIEAESPPLLRLLAPYLTPLVALLRRRGESSDLQFRLERSGLNWSQNTFFLYKTTLAVLAFCLGLLSYSTNPSPKNLMLWLVLSTISYFLPDVHVRGRILVRKEQILREFPDFIDAVRVYLATGMSIYQAMKYIAEISGPGLKPHLERLSTDMELYGQAEALQNFAKRVQLVEVDNFVVAMEQALISGMSLKELFAAQSTVLREMRRLALTKKIKQKPTYLALVGGLLFLNIFIIIGLPAMITLFAMKAL